MDTENGSTQHSSHLTGIQWPPAPFPPPPWPPQAQVGDIGLMGAPAKLDGKAVEGVKIFLGGKIGENPEVGAAASRFGDSPATRLAVLRQEV